MSIPNLPPFSIMTWVQDDNTLTTEAMLYNDELSQTLNEAIILLNSLMLSGKTTHPVGGYDTIVAHGFTLPLKTTSEINSLESTSPLGTLWFDTDTSKIKVKTASGVVETITSS